MHMAITNNLLNNHNSYFDIQTLPSYKKHESNINQTLQLEFSHPKHIFINKNPQKNIYFNNHSSTVIDDCNHSYVLVWTALSPFRARLNLRETLNTLRLLKRNWAQEGLKMCVCARDN